MYIVLLSFSANRTQASKYLDDHMAWIERGIDAGIFLLVGSVKPDRGGFVLARGVSVEALQARLGEDPFVAEDVVRAEIIELAPAKASPQLSFLLD